MANIKQLKQYNLITYILYILGFFVGLTPIVAIIMNYLKRNEMRGTWLESHSDWQIMDNYCCGGYAKTTAELIQFIQNFEAEYDIPLEQIYTGKMLMGLTELIAKGYFPAGSKLLVIHTGGLQGRTPELHAN